METDYLRINPMFHHGPRFDGVLIQLSETQFVFAQLACVFGVVVDGSEHLMALVCPFDEYFRPHDLTRETQFKDWELRFTRVRKRVGAQNTTAVISIDSIVRGALLVEDFGCESGDEVIVVDSVDQDWWLQMKKIASMNVVFQSRRNNLM